MWMSSTLCPHRDSSPASLYDRLGIFWSDEPQCHRHLEMFLLCFRCCIQSAVEVVGITLLGRMVSGVVHLVSPS
ncbi:unnamed protein product [Victoria cruziana]